MRVFNNIYRQENKTTLRDINWNVTLVDVKRLKC